MSDYKPLSRATFNRWKDAIFSQFGIIISCQRAGGYLYYIENPEDIDEDELKKWMLDSFAVSNLISENLSLKDRIIVNQIPSAREYLATLLEAMQENRVVSITIVHSIKQKVIHFPLNHIVLNYSRIAGMYWHIILHTMTSGYTVLTA